MFLKEKSCTNAHTWCVYVPSGPRYATLIVIVLFRVLNSRASTKHNLEQPVFAFVDGVTNKPRYAHYSTH